MNLKKWIIAFSACLFLISIFAVNWQTDRTNFGFISGFYAISFFTYLFLVANRKIIPFNFFVLIAVAAQLLALIYEPYLSNDYYRFIWDGEITWAGINPFDNTPKEMFQDGFLVSNVHLQNVYDGLSELSKQHYSCYPPVNQSYFILATAFSSSLALNIVVLKVLILITEIIGALYLIKTLKLLQIDTARMWILYLNPLWIIECTGNVHFEGVMISFLFIALYFLLSKREVMGSLFFAIAIQIKLIPLMLLPFFYRFLGFRKAMVFYTITIAIVIGFGFIQLNSTNIENFRQSLNLYFQAFEFNSFILHHYIQYGKMTYGWNLGQRYAPQLAKLAVGFVMVLALYGQISSWNVLFKRMTLAFFAYLLLSSNIHPWYILPLLALSLFTNYTFPLFWSFLIFFSYGFYAFNGNENIGEMIIRNSAYISLLVLFLYEIIRTKSPVKFLRLESFMVT